jgi:hypothetical protein
MPKRTSKPDENEIAFGGLQELLRRDEARSKDTDKKEEKPKSKKAKTDKKIEK